MQLIRLNRTDHLVPYTPIRNLHPPASFQTSNILFQPVQFSSVLERNKILTVQASFPASPPAQMKLFLFKTKYCPSFVFLRRLSQMLLSNIGTSTFLIKAEYVPAVKSSFPNPATQHLQVEKLFPKRLGSVI